MNIDKLNKLSDEEIDGLCYEFFANKELSFGCRLYMEEDGEEGYGYYIHRDEYFIIQSNNEWSLFMPQEGYDYKIIGHPPMLGDVLGWIRDNYPGNFSEQQRTLDRWIEPRKPLTEQTRECKIYCLSLADGKNR